MLFFCSFELFDLQDDAFLKGSSLFAGSSFLVSPEEMFPDFACTCIFAERKGILKHLNELMMSNIVLHKCLLRVDDESYPESLSS